MTTELACVYYLCDLIGPSVCTSLLCEENQITQPIVLSNDSGWQLVVWQPTPLANILFLCDQRSAIVFRILALCIDIRLPSAAITTCVQVCPSATTRNQL